MKKTVFRILVILSVIVLLFSGFHGIVLNSNYDLSEILAVFLAGLILITPFWTVYGIVMLVKRLKQH